MAKEKWGWSFETTSESENKNRKKFFELFKNTPIPDSQILANLGVYNYRRAESRRQFMYELYRKIINVHGDIMDFGTRWGQNMAWFINFRGMLEPYNHTRKVIGFDTFSGFPSVTKGESGEAGDMGVTEGYEKHLEKVLAYHESESPISHIRRFEIVKGDVVKTLPKYLKDNPQTIVALAYFDMDLYEPTKECLGWLKNHVTKGTVIGFDEVNNRKWAGETLALKEVLGLDKIRLQRSPITSTPSYLVIE